MRTALTRINVSSMGVETLIPSLAESLILSLEDPISMFSSNSRRISDAGVPLRHIQAISELGL